MADFFSGLNNGNIRKPDAKFGPGPLPTASVLAGGPAGINGNPDGIYNDAGGLLSGIDKYAGPKEGRISSDKQYQQIPHRMQHIVHMLYLPYADKRQHELVPMSHSVDQGDIAFVVNTNRIQGLLYNELIQRDAGIAQAQMPSRNAFVNLCTANYLLAGLQRLEPSDSVAPHGPWKSLALDMGFNPPQNHEGRLLAVMRFVRERLIPYGICAGSEHQGGKHETGLAPVQSASNHITSMTIDGQNRDLVNLWRRCDISAGDQLIFRLEYLPTQSYTLNHYYKGTVHQVFPDVKMCWQLVPDLFRMTYDPEKFEGLPRHADALAYDYRLHGFWRIGQSFQHRGRYDANVENYSNDRCFLSGQLLQITFAPVWCEFESLAASLKASAKAPPRAIATGQTISSLPAAQRGPRRGLHPGLQDGALNTLRNTQPTTSLAFAHPKQRSSLVMSFSSAMPGAQLGAQPGAQPGALSGALSGMRAPSAPHSALLSARPPSFLAEKQGNGVPAPVSEPISSSPAAAQPAVASTANPVRRQAKTSNSAAAGTASSAKLAGPSTAESAVPDSELAIGTEASLPSKIHPLQEASAEQQADPPPPRSTKPVKVVKGRVAQVEQ